MILPFQVAPAPLAFRVHVPTGAFAKEERVSAVAYLSRKEGEPRLGLDYFDPPTCYSARFVAKAGDVLTVDDANATGFPAHLAELKPGEYTIQAVVDRNLGGRVIGESPGNLYSKPLKITVDPASTGAVNLDCAEVVKEPLLVSPARAKQVAIPSKLLSEWYGRPTSVKAAVYLPNGYDGKRPFPTVYIAQGYGSTFRDSQYAGFAQGLPKGFVKVVLDANCPTGHSVFADSANNGPWGKALVREVIPDLERRFRLLPKTKARLLNGHSSGGWTSLWLQVTYPDFFGGTWSTAPDSVDFHNFSGIDLYKPEANAFTDEKGQARPIARDGQKVLLTYKALSDLERPIRGEQLGSFEGVFSPRGADGEPVRLWDRDTGAVNPKVAAAWRRYDITDKLRREWPKLALKLKGKLHVYCGNEDTFFLDGAVRRLQAQLKDYDAKVELLPGNHFTLLTPALLKRINREMEATQTR